MADDQLAEPEERGRTIIEDPVLERIAARAASEVAGVAQSGSDLARLIGRRLPKADAQVAGARAHVQIEIAVLWPRPLAEVAATVRDQVGARLAELTGLSIDGVDVEVSRVIHPGEPERRRVQ